MADVASTSQKSKTLALNSAASTNATLVKGSPGRVYSVAVSSTLVGTATTYVKLYDKATAPTVGTDRPVVVIPFLQSSVTVANGFAYMALPEGIRFSLGIGLATTLGAADTDTAAVAVNAVKVIVNYS